MLFSLKQEAPASVGGGTFTIKDSLTFHTDRIVMKYRDWQAIEILASLFLINYLTF